jgi:hypothetical protein
MARKSRFRDGTLGLVLAALAFFATLETQVAPGQEAMSTRFDNGPVSVNRALKGNRMPVASGANPVINRPEPKLPHGCELHFSSLRNAYANEVAGRCVAFAPQHLPPAMLAG